MARSPSPRDAGAETHARQAIARSFFFAPRERGPRAKKNDSAMSPVQRQAGQGIRLRPFRPSSYPSRPKAWPQAGSSSGTLRVQLDDPLAGQKPRRMGRSMRRGIGIKSQGIGDPGKIRRPSGVGSEKRGFKAPCFSVGEYLGKAGRKDLRPIFAILRGYRAALMQPQFFAGMQSKRYKP